MYGQLSYRDVCAMGKAREWRAREAPMEENDAPQMRRKKGFFSFIIKFLVNLFIYGVAFVDSLREPEDALQADVRFLPGEIHALKREILAPPENAPMVEIRGISFPAPGHIFRLKETATYRLCKPGTLVFVAEVLVAKQFWSIEEFPVEVKCFPLDETGRMSGSSPLMFKIQDLEYVSDEQQYFDNWNIPARKFEEFADGEAVETTEEVSFAFESFMGAIVYKFPKGTRGVIDSPEVQRGATLDDINSPFSLRKIPVVARFLLIADISIPLRSKKFTIAAAAEGGKCNMYFPSFQRHNSIDRSQLKRREYDHTLMGKVIMEDEKRELILSIASGKEEDLKRWGVSAFQKGMGKIFLAYGPPGTGKTMTGEALAEYLGRPLYFVNSMDLGLYTASFEENLKKVIDRTARWNAVTVIDESESILLSRDFTTGDSVARITAVLRNLERLNRGIIWFTTNRPLDIDFAIAETSTSGTLPKFPLTDVK